jgi:hypothetical protein
VVITVSWQSGQQPQLAQSVARWSFEASQIVSPCEVDNTQRSKYVFDLLGLAIGTMIAVIPAGALAGRETLCGGISGASHGNMSSATLPHVWMAAASDQNVKAGTLIASFASGPGLPIAGALYRKC